MITTEESLERFCKYKYPNRPGQCYNYPVKGSALCWTHRAVESLNVQDNVKKFEAEGHLVYSAYDHAPDWATLDGEELWGMIMEALDPLYEEDGFDCTCDFGKVRITVEKVE